MYVCEQLKDQTCVKWVVYQPVTLVDQLAITRDDMVMIGGSLCAVFAIFVAFTIVARAVNLL